MPTLPAEEKSHILSTVTPIPTIGATVKKTYTIKATIDAEGENSCGAKIENTANATINVNDVTEDCETPIVKP
jgi:hypothetical protein